MYILQNQDGYFLSKSGEWVDGREPSKLFRTALRDEAVNQLFETNSKDFGLRITLFECDINAKKLPVIPEDQLPPPLAPPSEIDGSDIADDEVTSEEPYNKPAHSGNEALVS